MHQDGDEMLVNISLCIATGYLEKIPFLHSASFYTEREKREVN